jgi:exopolysaccharide biosynthesis polyprenyl glycosylphosphotransferase
MGSDLKEIMKSSYLSSTSLDPDETSSDTPEVTPIEERSPARLLQGKRFRLPSLGLGVSERKLLLGVVDVTLLSLALATSIVIRTDLFFDLSSFFFNIKWFITLFLIWVVIAGIFDVYNLARAGNPSSSLVASTSAAAVTSLIYLVVPWLTPPIENRSQLFVFVALSVLFVGVWRFLYATLFVQPAFLRRALVIGAGNSGRALVHALQQKGSGPEFNPYKGTGHEIIGFVDDDPNRLNEEIEGVPVLGNSSHLVDLVLNYDVNELVIAITNTQEIQPGLFEAILDCRERGLTIASMTTIYERLTGRVAFEHASRNVEIASGRSENAWSRLYNLFKRLVDIFGALFGLFCMLVLVPFLLLANTFNSPGPLFFRQIRVGKGGHLFEVIKLRSMVTDAEAETGAVWARKKDSRITSIGRWLRQTHLDELPQVINVLRGEMSLVGPRPERPEFVNELSETIPFYRARHSVRPGITGWAQIHQDYGDSFDGAREKLEFDLYYIKRAGMIVDTTIMLRTVSKVIGFRGR